MNSAPAPSSPLPLALYLVAVTWAMMQSNKRWITLLWIVAGLAVTLGLFAVAAYIWPDLAGVLGHVAVVPTLLISALAGINHMRGHRRASPPKSPTPKP
ncbi:MAG: hypothetical protein WBS24_16125 [Terriglobales bacterium]